MPTLLKNKQLIFLLKKIKLLLSVFFFFARNRIAVIVCLSEECTPIIKFIAVCCYGNKTEHYEKEGFLNCQIHPLLNDKEWKKEEMSFTHSSRSATKLRGVIILVQSGAKTKPAVYLFQSCYHSTQRCPGRMEECLFLEDKL